MSRNHTATGADGRTRPLHPSARGVPDVLHQPGRRPWASMAVRAGVALLGGLTVLVGLVLVPLPGPGWPVVLLGLTVLGREFPWAARSSHVLQRWLRHAVTWLRKLGPARRPRSPAATRRRTQIRPADA